MSMTLTRSGTSGRLQAGGSSGDLRLDALRTEVLQQFAVTTSGTATPPPAGPVPILARPAATPLWSTFARGALTTAAQPVQVPGITGTGLAGTHSEGVEPTEGTIVASSGALSPVPISGEVLATREAVDDVSGRVRAAVVAELAAAYWSAAEQEIGTVLDAVTPVASLGVTGTGGALVADLLGEVVTVQLAAAAPVPRVLAVGTDLAAVLLPAADTAGAPLWPAVVAALAAVSVSPVVAPAVTSSWLLAPADLGAWVSTPIDLSFEHIVTRVTLGVWGYCLAAVTRPDGIHELAYS